MAQKDILDGDSIAGEGGLGTLRYLLVRPAGRSRLLAVKATTVAIFCLAATFVVASDVDNPLLGPPASACNSSAASRARLSASAGNVRSSNCMA